MADIFGCDDCQDSVTSKNDDMLGTLGAPTYAGLATKITAQLATQWPYNGNRATAALYQSSDDSLVATTAEVNVDQGTAVPYLVDFAFSPFVQLSVQDYLVCVYVADDENTRMYYSSAPGQKYVNMADIGTYPVFPDPLTSTVGVAMLMYCTYIPAAAGGMTLNLTPSVKGGTGKASRLGPVGGASFGGMVFGNVPELIKKKMYPVGKNDNYYF